MLTQFRTPVLLTLLVAASFSEFAVAQGSVPNSSGYTEALRQDIYRQDVGTGFSVGSLNQLALNNARAMVNYYGQSPSTPTPRLGLGLSSGGAAGKPFAGYAPEPTVSPYLNLFREDLDGSSDLNYNTLVRPMLQQQQFNQQLQRQSLELNRRLQAMAAQSDFNPQGSKSQYPTGHQTVFMYYGHYYPSANARRR